MTKPIIVTFNQGVQPTAKLGTLRLRLTAKGKAAYAQNIDSQNDEFGEGVILPGPALTTITGNSTLTGVPFAYAKYIDDISGARSIILAEGILGAKNQLRTIENVLAGGSPAIDTDSAGSKTVTHSGHSGVIVTDLLAHVTVSAGNELVVYGYDDSDTFVIKVSSPGTSMGAISNIDTVTTNNSVPMIMVKGKDGLIYGTKYESNQSSIWSLAATFVGGVTESAYYLPLTKIATAFCPFGDNLAIAWNNTFPGDFDQRKVGGKSGIILWDYVETNLFVKDIECPSNYISAVVQAPSGQIIVFGGLSKGRTTIYEFSGYGFNKLYSYIGDMPRSVYSVDFDGDGNLHWITADGQWCRLNLENRLFDHLGSITTGSSAAGILSKLLGTIGNDFVLASGSGSTYTMKIGQFGNYAGDEGGDDGITTPIIVAGTEFLPEKSNIQAITLHLAKPLASGEKVELRVYANGDSSTYTTYMTLDYSIDGAISSKRETITLDNINNFSLAAAYKMADGSATAPPIAYAEVEPGATH